MAYNSSAYWRSDYFKTPYFLTDAEFELLEEERKKLESSSVGGDSVGYKKQSKPKPRISKAYVPTRKLVPQSWYYDVLPAESVIQKVITQEVVEVIAKAKIELPQVEEVIAEPIEATETLETLLSIVDAITPEIDTNEITKAQVAYYRERLILNYRSLLRRLKDEEDLIQLLLFM